MKKNNIAFSLFLLLLPLLGIAHPGHGETGGFTITHYFSEPLHIIITLSVITAIVLIIRNLRKNEQHN